MKVLQAAEQKRLDEARVAPHFGGGFSSLSPPQVRGS
jgi:hypothetical protein